MSVDGKLALSLVWRAETANSFNFQLGCQKNVVFEGYVCGVDALQLVCHIVDST